MEDFDSSSPKLQPGNEGCGRYHCRPGALRLQKLTGPSRSIDHWAHRPCNSTNCVPLRMTGTVRSRLPSGCTIRRTHFGDSGKAFGCIEPPRWNERLTHDLRIQHSRVEPTNTVIKGYSHVRTSCTSSAAINRQLEITSPCEQLTGESIVVEISITAIGRKCAPAGVKR